MADEPKFLTRNYLDEFATLTLVNGGPVTAVLPRLFDRDRELLFRTSGADSDLTTVELTIEFKGAGAAVARTIDTIALLGHNLASVDFERWDGAAFVLIPGGAFTGLTTDTLVFSFSSLSPQRIKVKMRTTRTANQEKEAGELLVMGTLMAFAANDGFSDLRPDHQPVAVVTAMADDGVAVNQLRWAGNRVDRYRARMSFRLMTKAVLDSLQAVVKLNEVTAYPEPTQRPEAFYLGTFLTGGFPHSYTSEGYKGAGYSLDLEFRES